MDVDEHQRSRLVPCEGRAQRPGPRRLCVSPYGFCGQMKVLQLALNVRELSPMNSVAE
jgi:hypothetical protein